MQGQTRATALRHAIAVLRRRLPVLLACTLLVPAVAYVVSKRQAPRFEGTASVLLTFKQPAADGVDADQVFNRDDAQRFAATQATIARSPALVRRVVAQLARDAGTPRKTAARESVDAFLRRSAVVAQPNTDLLAFSVDDGTTAGARRAAATYARQFVHFRADLERGALHRSIAELRGRIRAARRDGAVRRARTLRGREQTLRTRAALPAGGAYYVAADAATPQVAPRTKRNVILGAALGLLLGLVGMVLREAVDTRVRRGPEIGEALGLPVLGRLPSPSRKARGCARPVVLEKPETIDAEAVRTLRAGFLLATRDGSARAVLVGSALSGEGKTTTTANLAAALAASGRHVIAVDLDLRNPGLGPMLGAGARGLTEVAAGKLTLDEALHAVELPAGSAAELAGGRLEVLGAGAQPPDPGDVVGTAAVAGVLDALRERADVVLVDSPPLLQVGDGLQLSTRVDAMLVVARVGRLEQEALAELRKLLASAHAPAVGVVLTGADAEDHSAPTYGYYLLSDESWAHADGARGAAAFPRS